MKRLTEETKNGFSSNEIGRREALKKAGKYAALTSATLFLVLSPKANADVTPPDIPPDWPPF